MDTETAVPANALVLAKQGSFNLTPKSLAEGMEFSKLIAGSELCPKDYRGKPQDVLIAVMMGAELGVSPMQAIQNIAVINGRPSLWGDLVLALIKQSGLLESIEEREPEDAWSLKEGQCKVKRKGEDEEVARRFSYETAERAGLVARAKGDGPWATYPGRMLQMRARALALRDCFPDVLKGLRIQEEEEDGLIGGDHGRVRVIEMPRRESEVRSGEVDGFLREAGAAQVAPRSQSAPRASAHAPSAAGTGLEVTIESMTEASGKTKDGRAWTRYDAVTSQGRFSTFDTKLRDQLRDAMNAGAKVRLAYDAGERGNTVTGVTVVPADFQ